MAKGKVSKTKGSVSSGVKKAQRENKRENYSPNLKTGKNPVTGKEFMIFNVENNEPVYTGTSYQTRIGAVRNKQKSQLIIERSTIKDRFDRQKEESIKTRDQINELKNELNDLRNQLKNNKNPDHRNYIQGQISLVQEKIQKLQNKRTFNLESLRKYMD